MQQELRIVKIYGNFCCTQANWTAISDSNVLVPLRLQCNSWLEHPDPRTGRVPLLGLSSSHSSSCWHTDLWPDSPASVLQMPRESPSKGRSSAELPVEITPVIEHFMPQDGLWDWRGIGAALHIFRKRHVSRNLRAVTQWSK